MAPSCRSDQATSSTYKYNKSNTPIRGDVMLDLSQRLNFAISPSLMARLREVAAAHEMPVSQFARRVLREAVAVEQQRRDQTKGAAQ